jgi:hypothetical protein
MNDAERAPVEVWRDTKKVAAWLFAAAKQKAGWASGQEVSEAEFDGAVQAAATEKL